MIGDNVHLQIVDVYRTKKYKKNICIFFSSFPHVRQKKSEIGRRCWCATERACGSGRWLQDIHMMLCTVTLDIRGFV